MPYCGAKVSMQKIKEILRLKFMEPPRSHREIGLSVQSSPSSVSDIFHRFRASELPWPLPDSMTDSELERRLYPAKFPGGIATAKVIPCWAYVHAELRKKNTTKALLWEEYKTANGDQAYEYSAFCLGYRDWSRKLNLSMRQHHIFGERCFVDFAGQAMPIINSSTGEITWAQIFVGVLGGSSFTFAEAVLSQELSCWIRCHVRMFSFFGGVTQIVVPDNLRSAVSKASFYDPEINPTYHEWAEHYGITVLPARVRKPKDKAKAEVAVQLVQRWILAALRNRSFYSLDELNEAIDVLQDKLNKKPFKKMPGSRQDLFEQRERALLRPLPAQPYDFGLWSRSIKVSFDYHVLVQERLYSAPYILAGLRVQTRASAVIVEIFHDGKRVASHRRQFGKGPAVTQKDHMPSNHRARADWTPQRVLAWAAEIGDSVRLLCEGIMEKRAHPELGFRNCLGVLQLEKKHGRESLIAACSKAICLGAFSYRSVSLMIANANHSRPNNETIPVINSDKDLHENLRGAGYWN